MRTQGRIVPAIAGWLTALIGAVNVLSAVTPELHGRLHVLRHAEDVPEMLTAQRLALPAGIALLVAAHYLQRRRSGALWTTVSLLVAIGVLDILKGLDVEEAAISWVAAAVLVRNRAAFCVRLDRGEGSRAVWSAAATAAGAFVAGGVVLALATPWESVPLGGMRGGMRDDVGLLSLTGSPMRFGEHAEWVPVVLGAIGIVAFLRVAWLLCRRPEPPASVVSSNEVARLVRAHGTDTLSAFKLRDDLEHLASPDGEAVISYRVQGGVLLIAGDPVGPRESFEGLLDAAHRRAEALGLRMGVLGASETLAEVARAAGMRSIYIGDEALVDTAGFSLEGRRIKKVRQAVGRVERHGYTVELCRHADLAPGTLDELEALSVRSRAGMPERGFSMALDGLRGEHIGSSWLVVARDADGAPRGFLHFTPTYGRPAASLGFMRRDRDTPNGLTDLLVVRAIEMLGAEGVEELSLNFAAFGRYLREPSSRLEQIAGRLASAGDSVLQIESLYRFNRKFGPRWVPRYLVYESVLSLPRTGIAAMRAEGQLGMVIAPLTARLAAAAPADGTG